MNYNLFNETLQTSTKNGDRERRKKRKKQKRKKNEKNQQQQIEIPFELVKYFRNN